MKTSIYHADAERDEYFSPAVFAFGQAQYDHNFSQGLDLQQTYVEALAGAFSSSRTRVLT